MSKGLTIIDKDYLEWVRELGQRYKNSRIKAAVHVNEELIKFYWSLGRNIVSMQAENRYGTRFYATLSNDLRREMPGTEGFSESNIRYAKRFYQLYANLPQLVGKSDSEAMKILPQLVEELAKVPWGHHRYILDRFSGDPEAALFYVHKTIKD